MGHLVLRAALDIQSVPQSVTHTADTSLFLLCKEFVCHIRPIFKLILTCVSVATYTVRMPNTKDPN